MEKVLILVIDGCAPAYLTEQTAPKLFALARQRGFVKTVRCAMPSVTNVNHACILSGRWPAETGVVGNYYYDLNTGCEGFIEERGYMRAPTILQRCQQAGGKTALFTVKGKVLGVYGAGADIGLSAQDPDPVLLRRYGLDWPPTIQSIEATDWIVRAACRCIEREDPDLVYCTTNDYIFHHFAPGSEPARAQITAVDDCLAQLAASQPHRQIYITADHGMNQKKTILNFQAMADRAGLRTYCLPPLKDRYIENHIYQEGGMLYVFLKEPLQREVFLNFAQSCPQVEEVLTAAQAAARYHLPQDQIGDYVLLAGRDCAFGEVEGELLYTEASRSHGSEYEREIPLLALGAPRPEKAYRYHKDIAAYLQF
ncbi:alkaline phosphatase family protein [Neobittarella massiliensis]|uniref:alkaline phosphatase family protein n=1 Tax=Neobittarella massiliensis (ex Bilen et al. 2018) TaxID=2041842 RepID=UPI000CF710F4|nr:alkaline phosphatase family protein [Neobittarella massiliensis]